MSHGSHLLINQSIERVRAFLRCEGVRKAEFARSAGLRRSVLTGAEAVDWSPNAETLRKLESAIPSNWQPGDAAPRLRTKDAA